MKNVKPVKNWREHQNVKNIQSFFLGLAGYYHCFIPNFSVIASPMAQLTKKNKTFNWTAKCVESFRKLKDLLIKTPILTFPTTGDHFFFFILDRCECKWYWRRFIASSQWPRTYLSYASKTLNHAKKRYGTTKRELLAIVILCETF